MDDAIAEAETALRQAELQLQEKLSRSINNGVMLESPEKGRELKRLRDAVEDARRRLDEARRQ